MKIVVLDRSSVGEDVSVEAIKQFGEVDFYNSTPDELVAERIADANIVVANKSPMNESTMKDAKQVKMICQLSTGYDNVDIEYCKNRGIHVANARNYSTAAVAQHTVALALSVLERPGASPEWEISGDGLRRRQKPWAARLFFMQPQDTATAGTMNGWIGIPCWHSQIFCLCTVR